MNPAFDLLSARLEPGVTLLEASAGTGKTYTLAGLFFRLIAEHDLDPGQILVSTYTEAATAELRDRIRTLLRHAWIATESGESDRRVPSRVVRHGARPSRSREGAARARAAQFR